MHHGQIREMGTHGQLLALGGLYARLHALQTLGHEDLSRKADLEGKIAEAAK